MQTLEWLRSLGLPVNEHSARLEDLAAVEAHVTDFERRRHDFDYEFDGLVAKVDDLGPPGQPRSGRQSAPLGYRLQVPARGAHHQAARHRGVDRPVRPGHTRSPGSSRYSSAA